MPRRRSVGKVFRRRRTVKDGAGGTRVGFRPGYYVRFRAGGREVTRFAGNDRDTAVAYAQRLTGEADRRDLLGETPRSDLRFEDSCDTYHSFARQSMTALQRSQ